VPIPSSYNKKFRYCYFKQALKHPSLDKEIQEKFLQLIATLQADGHTIDEIEFDLLDFVVPAYYVLTTAEASSNLSRYDGIRYGYQSPKTPEDLDDFYKNNRSEGFGMEVKRRIMLGTFVLSTGYYDAYYAKAQQVRRLISDKTKAIFDQFDLLVMPTTPSTAFKFGEKSNDAVEMFLGDLYTVYANLAGIAGISIPLFKHPNGMPFGMQIMANSMDEESLLAFSSYCLYNK
jgi:aspartyl-tRNA(Asn)/glutamyl-tRNA(Gln) amidotransferase subunit A